MLRYTRHNTLGGIDITPFLSHADKHKNIKTD